MAYVGLILTTACCWQFNPVVSNLSSKWPLKMKQCLLTTPHHMLHRPMSYEQFHQIVIFSFGLFHLNHFKRSKEVKVFYFSPAISKDLGKVRKKCIIMRGKSFLCCKSSSSLSCEEHIEGSQYPRWELLQCVTFDKLSIGFVPKILKWGVTIAVN